MNPKGDKRTSPLVHIPNPILSSPGLLYTEILQQLQSLYLESTSGIFGRDALSLEKNKPE